MRTFFSVMLVSLMLLAFAGSYALYYFGFRIEEMPTCMNFSASVSSDAVAKIQNDVQAVMEPIAKSKINRSASKVWVSDEVRVSYYVSHDGLEHSIFVCSNNRDPKLWKEVAAKVEKTLQQDSLHFKARLQMNRLDFDCGLTCATNMVLPLDFDKLDQTFLVPKNPQLKR